MSNFLFIQSDPDWLDIAETAVQAEKLVYSDPRSACFYARLCMERTIKEMYRIDKWLRQPYDTNLAALIHESSFRQGLSAGMFPKLKLIQKVGNRAVHSEGKITEQESLHVIKELHHFIYWFARTYSANKIDDQIFDCDLIKRKIHVDLDLITQSAKQLKKLQKELKEKDQQVEKQQAELSKKNQVLAEQNRKLLEQIQAQTALNKSENQAREDEHDYSESQTRLYLIDEMLKEMGWDISNADMVGSAEQEAIKAGVSFEHQVIGMPNNKGIGFVDYVLWGKDKKPLAVVEAKRTSISPKAGKQQARLYADCLEKMYGQRPLIYYSNGYDSFFWDDTQYAERHIQGFRNRDELQRLINRRSACLPIIGESPDKHIADRYYQALALSNIFEVFETHNQRKALLVMATGTGKTRTAIALVDILLKNNWAKNVLFLADRNALLTQAKKNFSKLLPRITPTILSGNTSSEEAKNRVCFATYPTMMNLLSSPPDTRLFGVGHFDLVIIDEAHRSVYKKFKYIFEYFDSLLVGLTATPKDDLDKNTYDIFDLEAGVPTYAYDLETAIDDKYLVPPKGVEVPLNFIRQGVKYDQLSEAEQEEWDEKESLIDRDEVLPSEVNKFLFNENTVDLVLKSLMEHGIKVDGGDTLGKTIIFAANNAHAEFILKRFDHHYAKYKGQFARVITYKVNYAQSLIDEFSLEAHEIAKNKLPLNIAISVDMLDTGIDVPAAVNLVFFKAIHSKVKFIQMVGRGTRVCENLFGPNEDKTEFKVFDVCQNFEYFRQQPEGAKDSLTKPISQMLFEKRLKIANSLVSAIDQAELGLRDYNLDMLHHVVEGMNLDNFIVRPNRKYIDNFLSRKTWSSLDENQLNEIHTHISSLPTEAEPFNEFETGTDLEKRFDNILLSMQLEYLQTKILPENLRLKIVVIAAQLEAKTSIPAVNAQLALIIDIQTPEFWIDIKLHELDDLRKRIRGLIEFIDIEKRDVVYTKFVDDYAGKVQEAKIDDLFSSGDMLVQYRKKVATFVREHEDQLTIQKLKRNKPITQNDLEQLEELLFVASEMVDRDAYLTRIHPKQSLGEFIRSVVGLERNIVKELFSNYLDETRFNAVQNQFINMILDSLCQSGTLKPELLYNPPFTEIHCDSIFGLFEESQAMDIVLQINAVNEGVAPRIVA
jgi:type I restriction enzyme R subunit